MNRKAVANLTLLAGFMLVLGQPTPSSFAQSTPVLKCEGFNLRCPVAGGCNITDKYRPDRVSPVDGRVRDHKGTDFRAATGTPILAAADGVIEEVVFSSTHGNRVIVRHRSGGATLYAHLQRATVAKGEVVQAGAQIGEADATGRSKGSHLHMEYVENGAIILSPNRIDPELCLGPTVSGSILVEDNGNLADDAFSVSIDGFEIGRTEIGLPNRIALNNLPPGEHVLTVKVIVAPDNLGTLRITLSDGFRFSDGTTSLSTTAALGQTVTRTVLVPVTEFP